MRYAVIENAGMDRETVVQEFDTYTAAMGYLDSHYDHDEMDELHVDVVGLHGDGGITTEV